MQQRGPPRDFDAPSTTPVGDRLAFSKSAPGHDAILVIVNLNPFHREEGTTNLDLEALGVEEGQAFEVHDLITDTTYVWSGPQNYMRLDPLAEPAHIFRVRA